MEMASSSMPARSRMMLMKSSKSQGLSVSESRACEPRSTRPTVLATQPKSPAQVTTNMMTAVSFMAMERTSRTMEKLFMVL